jgi:hypothetical protein
MNASEIAEIRQRLHDGLCQQLTAALMLSDSLRRNLGDHDGQNRADCEQIVRLLQQSALELNAVMHLVAEKKSAD